MPSASTLDPGCAHVLERLEAGGWLPLTLDPPSEARERFRALSLVRRGKGYEPPPVGRVEDQQIDGPGGPLRVRVYEPDDARPAVTVWLHGGGWVVGDLDTHDAICRSLALGARTIVVSVEYRLAPEHPFPAGSDDALAALCWAASAWPDHALAVGGDSAGGGLAAGAALRARDEGGPQLAAQLLVYPGLDPEMGSPSIVENGEGYFLTSRDMSWFWGHYLPDPATREHPWVNLLAASDLHGLPPTVITNAQFDPLRDEAATYAERLTQAGVPTTLVAGDGLVHGCLGMADIVPAAAEHAADVHRVFAALLPSG